MLARRDHSKLELTKKLNAKRYPPHEIEIVVSDLIQAGLLSDLRFTENYISSRRKKGYGPLRITFDLQSRGISHEMIAEELKIADNAWLAEARLVWQKHFKGKIPKNFKDKAKQIRFLQYRGFTQEQIENALEYSQQQDPEARD